KIGHVALDRQEIVLRHEIEIAGRDTEAVGPELDLSDRLLAGNVEHRPHPLGEGTAGLEQQRRLPDPGVTADQHERALHDTATQYPIKLSDAGSRTVSPFGRN